MQSNDELVDHLKASGVLYDEGVEAAMRTVDRKVFVPTEHKRAAYEDTPLPTVYGQTISAPHMVSIITQYLGAAEGMNVLEVGAGSGYQAAILSEIVGIAGSVVTMERVPELVTFAKKKLEGYENIEVIPGNGSKGYPPKAPYDRILVSCAARSRPDALLGQLAEGGRLVVPIGHGYSQELTLFERIAGKMETQNLNCDCRFVPLIE